VTRPLVKVRTALAVALVAVLMFADGSVGAGHRSTTAPPAITAESIRAAKVGWSRFVADNFAVPTAVPDPCPLLAVEAATAGVQALGLVPSALPYGVRLYRDATGAGVIGIACGVDLARAPDPPGSTGYVVEVTLLDGQAVFPQYVVRVAGQNTPITPSPELGGDVVNRCRNDPQVCVASWHADGLVVTARLDGPRTDQSEAQVRAYLVAIVPQVVANLASVSAAP
jgi:hypothetical protein